jgi:hypothetical protein
MKKIKKVRFTVLHKEEIIDYQTVIEEIIGNEISKLSCYDDNYGRKSIINGKSIEKDRAYFVPDCDYEIIIKPKRRARANEA